MNWNPWGKLESTSDSQCLQTNFHGEDVGIADALHQGAQSPADLEQLKEDVEWERQDGLCPLQERRVGRLVTPCLICSRAGAWHQPSQCQGKKGVESTALLLASRSSAKCLLWLRLTQSQVGKEIPGTKDLSRFISNLPQDLRELSKSSSPPPDPVSGTPNISSLHPLF